MAKIVDPDNTNKGELEKYIADYRADLEELCKHNPLIAPTDRILRLAEAVQSELAKLQDRIHDLEINNGRGR